MAIAVVATSVLSVQAAQVLDWDARVSDSITVDTNGAVSAWASSDANMYTGVTTSVSAPLYPSSYTTVSEKKGVDFLPTKSAMQIATLAESETFLDFSGAASNNTGVTMILSFHDEGSDDADDWATLIGNESGGGSGFYLRYDDRGSEGKLSYRLGAKTGGSFGGNRLISDGDTSVVALSYTATNGAWKIVSTTGTDGGVITVETGTIAADANGSSGDGSALMLGIAPDNGNRYFDGLIGQMQIYDEVLTQSNMAAIVSDMYDVWAKPSVTTILPVVGLNVLPQEYQLELSWSASVQTNVSAGFNLYRSEVSLGYTNAAAYVAGITNLVYTDTNVVVGTTYYYSATQVHTNGSESDFCAEVSAAAFVLDTNTVLLMHYDASDVASVSTTSSNLVSSWENLADPGTYTATNVGAGTLYPSTNLSASGMAGLDFTTNATPKMELMTTEETDDLLNFTTGQNGFVAMIALRVDGAGVQQDILGTGSGITSAFGMRWTGAGFQPYLFGAMSLPSPAILGDTLIFTVRYDVESNLFEGWESAGGNTKSASRVPADYSGSNPLTLGQTTSEGRHFDGQIFEMKIWGSTLDDAAWEAEREAMVLKWVGADAGYATWAGQWDVDLGESTNDYDLDGINNFYEYGLNGNPTSGVADITQPLLMNAASEYLYVHAQRNDDPSLVYTVETTPSLTDPAWTNAGTVVLDTLLGDGDFDTVTNTVDTTIDERFIRLIIEN